MPGLITTDGFEAYVEKIKAYFKGSRYAQVVKERKGGRISRVYNAEELFVLFAKEDTGGCEDTRGN